MVELRSYIYLQHFNAHILSTHEQYKNNLLLFFCCKVSGHENIDTYVYNTHSTYFA